MRHRGKQGSARAFETLPVATAIAATLKEHRLTDQVRAGRLVTEWTELVGPRIAGRTRADGIRDRILWIEVASSSWLHELNLMRPQLVRGLLERLGAPRLFDDVKFRLAGRSGREVTSVPTAQRRPARPPRPPTPPASIEARERIAREVASVEDPDLRELIARVRVLHDR